MNRLYHIVIFLGIGILFAQEPPEEFQYNQSTLQGFYYFNSVTINGFAIESNDWVGAFNGDVCVGAQLWETFSCGNGVCDITVMGDDGWPETSGYMQNGEIPTFKIYDTSEGNYFDAHPNGEINTNGGECIGVVPECMNWSINNLSTIDNLNGVISEPELFSFNQSTLQAFYFFNTATINGVSLESDDWVGAFRNGYCSNPAATDEEICGLIGEEWYPEEICVGARKWGVCEGGSGCDVPAMGNDGAAYTVGYMTNGVFPIFKIYDTSHDQYLDAIVSTEFPWENFGYFIAESIESEYEESCEDIIDCAGNCGGNAYEDECGTCDDDSTNDCVQDCIGDWGGDANVDECGVCEGDNSSCSGCTESFALNYDDNALMNDGSCIYPVYGCLDETALNYDPEATNSNGNCDYPPEVGIWIESIDADAGSLEIYSSSDYDLDNISFSISGATITGTTEGIVSDNNITISGSMNAGSGLLTVLIFTDGGSEFCLSGGSATASGFDSVNITLGGCSVLVGLEGGIVESETGGVDIPEGALTESENIAVGNVTEELPEEVDNATGFEVEELVAFTPFDLVFEVPVEISVSSTSPAREDEYLCYLEDANDTEWTVVGGASCTDGTCVADITEFGIFATCILVEDCNGDLGGFAYLDDCGECVGGETGNAANYSMDECGLCNGPGYIEWYIDADGDNLGYGDGVPFCSDVVPDGYVPNNDDSEPNCATNDTDECDLCGGDGPDAGYDCDGICIDGFDCEGLCGGISIEDDCGVCNGNDNDGNGTCDIVCEGIIDCAGNCDGNSIEDDCGVCNGSNTCAGCDGVANSGLVIDECGECGGDGVAEGDCDCEGNVADCLGICGGSTGIDGCGVCSGPGQSIWYGDSDGDGLGDPDDMQMSCDSLEGYVPNDDDEYPGCGSNYFDCNGLCDGSAVEDECGVCDGDNSSCADECGVPNGDNSSCTDECGVINGNGYIDDCGICDSDPSNDCECDYYDNCGVCNGDNSDCWFIDITTGIGSIGEIVDSLSRIGMHEAAADGFNADDILGYSCENCYKDEVEIEFTNPTNWVDFYFPHPEWEEEIHDFIFNARTDLKKDIRHLETFTLADLDNNSTIFVDEQIYYIQQAWDIGIETDQNISFLPFGENFVKLDFNFINQIPNSADGFTKVFFYKEVSGIGEMEEISPSGGSSDPNCISDYCVILDNYDLLSNFRIILGTDTVQPSATIVSPLPNEIFALEDDNFPIELQFDNPEMIAELEFFFDIDGEISEAISVDVNQFVNIPKNNYYEFLNDKIAGDFIENINIFIEVIDVAGSTVIDHPGGEYHSEMGPLTFSRNEITSDLESGWHLLAPPLEGQHNLSNIFDEEASDCIITGCTIIETANSGNGFYVRSYGESPEFTFTGEVLPEFTSTLEQGWNLIGNPLVNSVDVNSVIITHNNTDYNWPDAAKYGIISPTPIIYDNESGGHIGATEFITAAGFWVHSFFDDVEISFVPSNLSSEVDESNYWNLSLFAKEYNAGVNSDESIGSEIVIGIHEEANNAIINGEDQEVFPLNGLSIFEHYNNLSINNNGTSSLYRDIRSYHETSIIWDLEGESVLPYNPDEGVRITWEFTGNNDPYDYYLDIGVGAPVNMKEESSAVVAQNHFSEEMRIIAELKEEYIGCTHPFAGNYNLTPEGDICTGGTCLGGNQADFCEILSLSLPETFAVDPDLTEQNFELPISLDNPQNIAIEGLQFNLVYDAEMIQLNGITLNDNFGAYFIEQELCTNCMPAELSVIVYFNGSGEMYSGEGEILTLLGNGLENTGTTTISFSSVQINENENAFGNSCEISIGLVYLSVSGELIYYKNGMPVYGGIISITEIDNLSNIYGTTTNESGDFFVESILGDRNYELNLSKDEYEGNLDNYFDGLSAVDASRIARHAVGLFEFSEKEKLAANVNFDYRCEDENGNPTEDNENECDLNWVPNIEAGDASKVARFAAGIIEDLNVQCDPHWIFINPDMDLMLDYETCENISYELDLDSSITNLTFEGIRLGDVTGNWTAPLGRQNDNNIVDNPIVEVELDQIVNLPLYLPNKVEIEGVDLTIQFDPEVFSLIGYNINNSILDKTAYTTIINDDTPGLFKLVSYANSTLVDDNGLLGSIKFKVISQARTNSTISIHEMNINEFQEGGFLVESNSEPGSIAYGFDFQISAVPEVFALGNNYPNPFNPRTNIQFELPIDGNVKIFIYDIKGSLIDELMNGYMEAGYHQIKWDGSRQASGMYFIQMIADNGNYIKMTKMMLVK